MKGTWAIGTAAILLATASPAFVTRAGAQQRIPERPGAEDRLAPPRTLEDSPKKGAIRVANATLTPLSSTREATTARLTVIFEPRRPAGTSVTIRPDGQTVVLRDDGAAGDSIKGDGIF